MIAGDAPHGHSPIQRAAGEEKMRKTAFWAPQSKIFFWPAGAEHRGQGAGGCFFLFFSRGPGPSGGAGGGALTERSKTHRQEAKRRRQKRAQQKAERVAAAEMANQLTLRKFNTFMLFMHSVFETDWVPMDGDEWDAFIEWLSKQQDGAEFDRSTCEGFYDGWCDSNDYAAYQMELNYESVLGDAGWDPSHEREDLTSEPARLNTDIP